MKLKVVLYSAILALSAITAAAQDYSQGRWAVVDLSCNYLREEPDYAAELGTQALMGTVVQIIDESGYWLKVISPEPYTAWATDMGFVEMSGEEIEDYIASSKYICTAAQSAIYSEPDLNSMRISDFIMGDLVRALAYEDGEYSEEYGFVEVMLPSGRTGWVLKQDVELFHEWAADAKPDQDSILGTAYSFLGVPYMWAGMSPKAFDCSGFSRFVYFMNGILLPRNASQQVNVGLKVEPAVESLQPGDLLFFGTAATADKPERITHVAIYIGDGLYIHASHYVRISSIDKDSDLYAGRYPLQARRILGQGVAGIIDSPYYFAK